jgi:hypothetical protein
MGRPDSRPLVRGAVLAIILASNSRPRRYFDAGRAGKGGRKGQRLERHCSARIQENGWRCNAFPLCNRSARRFEQFGAGDNDPEAFGAGQCHIESVSAAKKVKGARHFLWVGSRHGDEDRSGFLALKLVRGADESTLRQYGSPVIDLHVVRADDKRILLRDRSQTAVFVVESLAQQPPVVVRDDFLLLFGFLGAACVFYRKNCMPSSSMPRTGASKRILRRMLSADATRRPS